MRTAQGSGLLTGLCTSPGSGVHGALVVLDSSFGADSLAAALGIPQSKTMLRRHLATELEKLMRPARSAPPRFHSWYQPGTNFSALPLSMRISGAV